jgi:GTP cyclohydrolase FolE2
MRGQADRRSSPRVMENLLKHSKQTKLIRYSVSEQLRQIFTTTLSSVICRNSDKVEYSQRYVMKRVSKTNPLQKCSEIDIFDFEPWKELKMVKVPTGEKDFHAKSVKN